MTAKMRGQPLVTRFNSRTFWPKFVLSARDLAAFHFIHMVSDQHLTEKCGNLVDSPRRRLQGGVRPMRTSLHKDSGAAPLCDTQLTPLSQSGGPVQLEIGP